MESGTLPKRNFKLYVLIFVFLINVGVIWGGLLSSFGNKNQCIKHVYFHIGFIIHFYYVLSICAPLIHHFWASKLDFEIDRCRSRKIVFRAHETHIFLTNINNKTSMRFEPWFFSLFMILVTILHSKTLPKTFRNRSEKRVGK